MPTQILGKVKITPRGAYDPAATYVPLDIVSYGGGSYCVLKNVTGITPAGDDVNYQLLAESGADGKSPQISASKTWLVWDAEAGEYVDTGVSAAGEIPEVDDTLTQPGRPADAAKVGEELRSLSEEMLTEESDPTVPSWAKAAQKPSYTASEVGADPSGTAASQVSAHNTGTDTHSDIRLSIQGLTDRLNALADSDDNTLDQLSEIVAYIKSNRDLISSITTDKVSVADIVDNLTTNVANKPLSAAQGVALKALIDTITVPDKLPNPNALTFTGAVEGSYDGSAPLSVEIPSGGGGIGTGAYEFSVLASGTIPANTITAAEIGNGMIDTGITLGMLRQYKIFNMLYRCDSGNQYYSFTVGNPGEPLYKHKRFIYDTSNARNATILWLDSARTAVLMLCGVGNSRVTPPAYAELMGSFRTSGLCSGGADMSAINAYGNLADFTDESKIYVGVMHMNGQETNTKDFTWAICGVVK